MAGTYRAQGRGIAFAAAAVAVAFLMCVQCTVATDYPVGGTGTWTFSTAFQSWADGQTFVAGDQIMFTYPVGTHTVVTLSQSDWENCIVTSPLTTATNGNTTITLVEGTTYFTCGVTTHCPSMKFSAAVGVTSPNSPTPPTVTAPPPPNAAGSVKATLATVFGAAALALVM